MTDDPTKSSEAKKPVLRVAVAQIDSVPYEVNINVDKHFKYIEEARAADVDLLVFPELSITGYPVGFRALEVAITQDDQLLTELASESGPMRTVVGFVEDGYAAQIHNTCAVLHDGDVQFIHRKLNLASYGNLEEKKHYAGGRYIDVFKMQSPWIGSILVCADLWNPALVQIAALYGTTLLIAPVASSERALAGDFSNPMGWETVIKFYSMIYGFPVIMANFSGGISLDDRFWGGSRVVDPYGNTLIQAGDGEELIIAEIDYNGVRDARFRLPTVRDSNLDLIQREIGRLTKNLGVPFNVRT
ncbi:nitrilase-related carbon-nitrogen hydrolase [Thalassoroseus pseudoceratinae]|uniref:nitrilase-related carbon-nitrogen hydrolase n=1 Tax=Thalassoroseus pseudoceratinae TaxID=2713176 RepID=UPI001424957E|nr:nitrilase-related carbon-nitrogen hydrolase [Thalassoroseus pseudoceratinae]